MTVLTVVLSIKLITIKASIMKMDLNGAKVFLVF